MEEVATEAEQCLEFIDKAVMPYGVIGFGKICEDSIGIGAQLQRRIHIIQKHIQQIISTAIN